MKVEDVERLSAIYGQSRTSFIRLGEGMTRLANGGQALRAVCTLPALTGAYSRRGGGALLMTPASMPFNYNAIRKPSGPAATRLVNHLRLGEDLLNMKDPPIRGLFVAANNPAITCPEATKVRRGLARDDLFTVVHDPFMTMTARYADIVLPSTTYLETEDFYRSYGSYYMQYAPRAVEPQGEAWSNLRFAQTMAQRMGLEDRVFRLPECELVHELFRGAGGTIWDIDSATILTAGPVKLEQSDAQTFATPSGKLEIYSETLGAMGINPMPDWRPDLQEERDAANWPLRLLTAPGYFQPHTAYEGVAFLKRRQGPVACIMHPADADSRGLIEGDVVRLKNDRAQVRMTLHVSDEVQRGVVLVPGQRTDTDDESGTVNMLCSDRYTDMGEGATYQSTFLDVTKWEAAAA